MSQEVTFVDVLWHVDCFKSTQVAFVDALRYVDLLKSSKRDSCEFPVARWISESAKSVMC